MDSKIWEQSAVLGLTAVRSLTIPPCTAVAINDGTRRAGDGDVCASNGDHIVV